MREILQQLNENADILGSIVITPDGIMVAAALQPDLEEEKIAAFTSSLLLTLKKSLQQLNNSGSMSFCTINSTEGKLIFFDLENSFLVLVSRPNAQITSCMEEINHAITEIQNRRVA